jgi:murein DD-endopeptidase MepM/ murein hydrolase activator NlpD
MSQVRPEPSRIPRRFLKKLTLQKKALFFFFTFMVILFVTGFELRLLNTRLLINDIIEKSVDYEAYREYRISGDALKNAEQKAEHLIKKYPQLRDISFADTIGYLTFNMLVWDYDLIANRLVDEATFYHGIGRVASTKGFQELYRYNKAILSDLKYFPVPRVDSADISYVDSWYGLRTYGGERKHEGTDLMASNNQRDFFPIISITDGTVEKMGWLEQGGYRIGIRSEAGGYFYYAHLSSYAPELSIGDSVIAGQILGLMGDSGYGSEGTIGQFDVHLHFGIYVTSDILGTGEMSVNPYYILKLLEKNRTYYGSR